MLYLDHDFYSNFSSGISSGDNDFITDMIVNEASELIVYKTDKVIDLLNTVGIKTNDNVSDEKIVDNIVQNLSSNVKLNKGLAFLIAENNDASKTKTEVRGADGKVRESRRKSRGATMKEIDSIASGIMGIGDSFTHKPQLQKEFKLKLMKVIDTKSKAVGERDREQTTNKNGKYWLLAIVVIGAGVGLYFYLKHKKKIAQEGMVIEGAESSVIVPPSDVAPVVTEPIVPPTPEVPIDAGAVTDVPPVV